MALDLRSSTLCMGLSIPADRAGAEGLLPRNYDGIVVASGFTLAAAGAVPRTLRT